jgi:hypothetical protein
VGGTAGITRRLFYAPALFETRPYLKPPLFKT